MSYGTIRARKDVRARLRTINDWFQEAVLFAKRPDFATSNDIVQYFIVIPFVSNTAGYDGRMKTEHLSHVLNMLFFGSFSSWMFIPDTIRDKGLSCEIGGFFLLLINDILNVFIKDELLLRRYMQLKMGNLME